MKIQTQSSKASYLMLRFLSGNSMHFLGLAVSKSKGCMVPAVNAAAVWHTRTEGYSFHIRAIRSALVAGLGKDLMGLNGTEIKESAAKPCRCVLWVKFHQISDELHPLAPPPQIHHSLLTTRTDLCLPFYIKEHFSNKSKHLGMGNNP